MWRKEKKGRDLSQNTTGYYRNRRTAEEQACSSHGVNGTVFLCIPILSLQVPLPTHGTDGPHLLQIRLWPPARPQPAFQIFITDRLHTWCLPVSQPLPSPPASGPRWFLKVTKTTVDRRADGQQCGSSSQARRRFSGSDEFPSELGREGLGVWRWAVCFHWALHCSRLVTEWRVSQI